MATFHSKELNPRNESKLIHSSKVLITKLKTGEV